MKFLETVIEHNCIALQQEASTWQEAVKLGCDLLEENGFVTADYYKGILKSTEENGPYYVLTPGFAMPHARPEAGALKTGFSLIVLKTGIAFGSENDPVDLIVTLSAKNTEEMNEWGIARVMEFLGDEEIIKQVREANSLAELE